MSFWFLHVVLSATLGNMFKWTLEPLQLRRVWPYLALALFHAIMFLLAMVPDAFTGDRGAYWVVFTAMLWASACVFYVPRYLWPK